MVDGLDEQTRYEVGRAQTSSYSCVAAQYALDAPPRYAHEDLNNCALNGFAPPSIKEFRGLFHSLHEGEMSRIPVLAVHTISNIDPSRAPAGKAAMTSGGLPRSSWKASGHGMTTRRRPRKRRSRWSKACFRASRAR